jgi:hypothetical protein
MEPDETGTPDEPITETTVARAIEVILGAIGQLESRQNLLQKDMENLTGCFRETLKSLKVLAAAVSVHDKALDIRFPDPPAPAKTN